MLERIAQLLEHYPYARVAVLTTDARAAGIRQRLALRLRPQRMIWLQLNLANGARAYIITEPDEVEDQWLDAIYVDTAARVWPEHEKLLRSRLRKGILDPPVYQRDRLL